MFGRKRPPATIHVEFFDAETGGRFAEVDLPPDRLPESFEAATTMHIGEQDWQVERAEPMTATEFRESGRLRLVLRRVTIETIDPREVLFSLPTIADELPAMLEGSTKLGRDVLELHEDDWRQTEFVSALLEPDVDACLDAIRDVYANKRKGDFFRELHVRREVPEPLRGLGVTLLDLRQTGGPRATWLDGIAGQGVAGLVADGFAVRLLSSVELYGLADGRGQLRVLGLHGTRANNAGAADVTALREFAASNQLLLVDWCSATKISAFDDEFETFFSR
jgi:hypothetical protein